MTRKAFIFRSFLVAAVLAITAALWSVELRGTADLNLEQAIETGQVGWRVPVPTGVRLPFQVIGDSNELPARSELRLYEDGRLIGPPHQLHSDIMAEGSGRYSHWGGWLYLSASDNSDPRKNGHSYRIEFPIVLHRTLILALALLAIASVFAADILREMITIRASANAAGRTVRYAIVRKLVWLSSASIPDRWFWAIFAILIGGGIAVRAYFIAALGLPYVVPDSYSYVYPALITPWLPFGEARTAGLPYLIVLGMGSFGHPAGFLVLQGLLWLASTIAFVVALKRVLGFRILALVMLAYLAFVHKNLALEFTILSEHAARCAYLLTIALMLFTLRSPGIWAGVGVAVLVVFNILIKPSAMAFLPVIAIWYGLALLLGYSRWRPVLRSAAVCTSLIATMMVGYMYAFEQRFGTFGLSHFDGYNLYAQVGHLTVLDRGPYPEIKADLREYLPLYKEKYASQRNYQWNWLIYGATNPEMTADFGDRSPIKTILKYQGSTKMGPTNQVFRDLALESIKANPAAYLDLTIHTFVRLMGGGFNFSYGNLLTPESQKFWQEGARELRRWFFDSKITDVPLRRHIRGGLDRYAVQGLKAPGSEQPAGQISGQVSAWIGWATHYFSRVAWISLFTAAIVVAFVLPSMTWAAIRGRLTVRGEFLAVRGGLVAFPKVRSAALFLVGITVLGYGAALSLYSVSDPTRFLANVQDLYIASLLAVVVFGARQGCRALILMVRADRRDPSEVVALSVA